MKLLRRAVLVSLLGLLALAAGLAAFLYTLDVGAYKARLVTAIAQATGRDFAIGGDIAFKPAMLPTVGLHDITLGNPEWAGPDPFVRVSSAEAEVDLRALFDRRFEITRIRLVGVVVDLARKPDGSGNWQLGATPPEAAAGRRLPPIELKALAIEDLTVRYRAADATAEELHVEMLELATPAGADAPELNLRARYRERPLTLRGTLAPLGPLLGGAPLPLDLAVEIGDLDVGLTGVVGEPVAGRGIDLIATATAPVTAALASVLGRPLTELGPLALKVRVRDRVEAWDLTQLELTAGKMKVAGMLSLARGTPRTLLRGELDFSALDLRPWQAPPSKRRRERLFSNTPFALAALGTLDAELALRANRLTTRSLEATELSLPLTLTRGVLAAPAIAGTLAGGRLAAALELDAAATTPRLALELEVAGMSLAGLLPQARARGGRADLTLALEARGTSPAALAASATGRIKVDAGDIELISGGVDVASADLLQAFSMLNPLAQREPRTRIECAVINFPIVAGRMQATTGLGVRTDKLNILGGGTIDLGSEQIDIGVNPKPRAGIGLNMAGLADFVRIGGSLAQPRAVTDARGMATAGVKVGAAMATGGLSLLAEGLLDRAEGDVDVCAVARGDQALPGPAPSAQPSVVQKAAGATTQTLKNAGGAIKDAFKGLFGR